jgi:Reverse transcriptase (RNA-dependent DNA polymerase)
MALAAEHDLKIHQMDVKSAYLNRELKEKIFMEPPPGLEVLDGMVLKLLKAIYGTKQGAHVWYESICMKLENMGYQCTAADHAVFIRVHEDGTLSIIALYVNDITMVSNSLDAICEDKEALKRAYQMSDLGEISWILGMHVTCDRLAGQIALSQERFIIDLLDHFDKSSVHPISTPSLVNQHLIKLPSPESNIKYFQRAIGGLMYPMLGTCPDLAFSVASLRRHASSPGEEHLHALNCVFHYLRATADHKLVFQRGTPAGLELHGFMDADWAGDVNNRKSTSGYIFLLTRATISWSSKKQLSIALSSTEAKYITGTHAAKEATWLRCLLSELWPGPPLSSPTTLLIDNQFAIAIAHNPKFHDRTKHIEVRHHFLHQQYEAQTIDLKYVPTDDQTTDILTKGLAREKHERFTDQMGVCHMD